MVRAPIITIIIIIGGIILCLSGSAMSTTIGAIAIYSHRNIDKSLYEEVQLTDRSDCLDQDLTGIIYGNERYGYFQLKKALVPSKKTGIVKVLPLSGRKTIHHFYCRSPSGLKLLASKNMQNGVPAMFKEISSKLLKQPLSSPFHLGIGSIPFMSPDFLEPEERKNIGFVFLMNRYGEIIWVHLPAKAKKTLNQEINVSAIDGVGYALTSDNYWEVFNESGKILNHGTICKPSHQCVPRNPTFIGIGSRNHLLLGLNRYYWKRQAVEDWIYGPKRITRFAIGRLQLDDKIFQFTDESLPLASDTSGVKAYHKTKAGSLLIEDEQVHLHLASGQILKQTFIGALDAQWDQKNQSLLILGGLPGSMRLNQYEIRQQALVLTKAMTFAGNNKWYRASMHLGKHGELYVYAVKSNPNRYEIKSIPPDEYTEINLDSSVPTSNVELNVTFYSQSLGMTSLATLPGTEYLGDHIESL